MTKKDDLRARVINRRIANKVRNMPGAFKQPRQQSEGGSDGRQTAQQQYTGGDSSQRIGGS